MAKEKSYSAVVTGASSGIGWEIASQLANEGWRVLAVARRGNRLEQLAERGNGNIIPCPCDLTSEDGPRRVIQTAQDRFRGLDLLVNNAGTSWVGTVAQMPDDRLDCILNLNVRSLIRMCREAIPLLSDSSRGQIINVSSVAADLPVASLAVYCASKASVTLFTRTLAIELAGEGIRVNVLSPAGTDTEIFDVAGVEVDREALIPVAEMARMAVMMTQFPDSLDVSNISVQKRFAP